jgi:hypothetical protein
MVWALCGEQRASRQGGGAFRHSKCPISNILGDSAHRHHATLHIFEIGYMYTCLPWVCRALWFSSFYPSRPKHIGDHKSVLERPSRPDPVSLGPGAYYHNSYFVDASTATNLLNSIPISASASLYFGIVPARPWLLLARLLALLISRYAKSDLACSGRVKRMERERVISSEVNTTLLKKGYIIAGIPPASGR